jgi:hypothetical protein
VEKNVLCEKGDEITRFDGISLAQYIPVYCSCINLLVRVKSSVRALLTLILAARAGKKPPNT